MVYYMSINWSISFTSKAAKQAKKLPKQEQATLGALLRDLTVRGPVLADWPNYSKLGGSLYHCHLSYKWVACWELKDKQLRLIEIYYAGSRENAPY